MSRSAAILHADESVLARLCHEGGLLDGFLGRFDGSLTDTAGSGEGSLDRLLVSHAVVALPQHLVSLAPVNPGDAALLRNLTAKVESRLWVRLLVLSGDDDDAASRIDESLACPYPARASTDRTGAMKAVLVVVLERVALTPRVRAALARSLASGCFRNVYLMTTVLEQAGGVVVRAENVWPVCVARLMVALAARPDDWWTSWDDKSPRLLLWRTIAWGTDGPSGAAPSKWERAFLDRLQATLVPTTDAAKATPAALADTRATAEPPGTRRPPAIDWADDPESYGEIVGTTIGDEALVQRSDDFGAGTRQSLADKEARMAERLDGPIRRDWETISGVVSSPSSVTPSGIEALQRLAQARPSATGGPQGVERIRGRIEARLASRLEGLHHLAGRRDQVLREATPTLELARAKFVPIWWRTLIGVAVTLSVLALLLGMILPFRPPPRTETKGPSFMGLPLSRKSVAFLVDRSESMEGRRLERLKSELDAAVHSLPADARFTIAAFSSDTAFMPGGERSLVDATNATRHAASEWIQTLSAEGGTLAADGLARLVTFAPSEIVLLTDGEIQDSDRVSEIVDALDGATGIHFNTVSLFGDSGSDFLRQISEATQGTHTFVPFDPFDPPGFPWFVLLVVGSTALGAWCGALLPWLLERRAGRAAAKELATCAVRVRDEFESHLQEGRAIVSSIADVHLAREQVATGAFQRALATRALGLVRTLFATAGNAFPSVAERSQPLGGGRLAAEDRADARRLLDIPLDDPEQALDPDTDEVIARAATDAATGLREAWTKVCIENDRIGPCGHLPAKAIETIFGTALQSTLGRWQLMVLLRRPSIHDEHRASTSTTGLAGELESLLGDSGNHADLLSAPIDQEVPILLSECRRRQWIELTKPQALQALRAVPARLSAIYQRMRVERRDVFDTSLWKTLFEDDDDAPPGVAALGLVHEEIRIEFDAAAAATVVTAPATSPSETLSPSPPRVHAGADAYTIRRWS